jgi:hypothetical protein
MFRLILALTFWTGSAVAQSCLPDPTQACVFQMALRQADAALKPASIAAGYMAVAFLQEDGRMRPLGRGDPG